MSARFVLNDGQHRRAAIEMAMRENPSIGDESIAVVFFLDQGLARCQQMFADLNRYAIRPARSLGVLYDHRDDKALLAKLVVARAPVFRDVVEMERTTLAPRSRRLFTLSAIYNRDRSNLLQNVEIEEPEERARLAAEFWGNCWGAVTSVGTGSEGQDHRWRCTRRLSAQSWRRASSAWTGWQLPPSSPTQRLEESDCEYSFNQLEAQQTRRYGRAAP